MGNHTRKTNVGEASRLPSPEDVTITDEQLDEAFDDGYNAANDGKAQSDCPIMAGKLCIEWVKGWKNWYEENEITAKLGAAPNEHGVYTCEPDKVLEWKNKNDYVEIKLIALISGKWTYSISNRIADEGSGSLPSIHSIVDSLDDALRIAQEKLLKICAKGKDSGLNAKDLKDFTAFVNSLVESDERKAA
jgi:ribosome modulation factor